MDTLKNRFYAAALGILLAGCDAHVQISYSSKSTTDDDLSCRNSDTKKLMDFNLQTLSVGKNDLIQVTDSDTQKKVEITRADVGRWICGPHGVPDAGVPLTQHISFMLKN
jgi:hypothetical protein